MQKPILALTMGDPGGIGPEVIAKTFRGFKGNSSRYYLLIGSKAPFEILKKKSKLNLPLYETGSLKNLSAEKLNFFDIAPAAEKLARSLKRSISLEGVDQGRVTFRNACLTYAALQQSAVWGAQRKIQGLVTAPINKTTVRLIEKGFHGHTEFLAHKAGVSKFAMMFVGDKLKVTLVTIHEPIRNLSKLITAKKVFEKIQLTHNFLRNRFGMKKPRLGVCALNPHGRETGTEDEAQIRPAVNKAKKKGIAAFGPLSADQIFHDAYEGRFDAVISMYHDQGLAPFKMISFRDGVNVTLGLPYVRTSPDHGTAFDIAYQNKADAESFCSALKLAERLIR